MAEASSAIDREAIATLLVMVGDDRQLAQMHSAATMGDAAELVRPAHTLKTNSRNLGAQRLAGICLALELDARRGDVGGAHERIAEAEAAFDAARAELLAIRDE